LFKWLKSSRYRLPELFRCSCGSEYKPHFGPESFNPGCPACGRLVPKAAYNRRWKSYREHCIEELQWTMRHRVKQWPKEEQNAVDALIKKQIEQLTDGSYVEILRGEICELEKLVASDEFCRELSMAVSTATKLPPDEDLNKKVILATLRKKREELELAEMQS
jgi:hypothetical protein